MNDIQAFAFGAEKVRVIEINGAPWFVAADVCRCLGLPNTTMAVRSLSADEKRSLSRIEVGLSPGAAVNLITESGLYKLVMRSDKPQARKFQDWVTRDVLPAIRKDGAYIMGEEKVAA